MSITVLKDGEYYPLSSLPTGGFWEHLQKKTGKQTEISPLLIDKLSLTVDIHIQYQQHIIGYIQQNKGWKPKSNTYSWTTSIPLKMGAPEHLSADKTQESHVRISAGPKDPSYRFLRVEFNPAMIDMVILPDMFDELLPKPLDYSHITAVGRVTRVDWAVDVMTDIDTLFFHSLRKQWNEVITKSGKTIYLGHRDSQAQFCLYDKATQIMEKNKHKDPSLHQEKPKTPITRIELRQSLKGELTLDQLPTMNNPFSDLMIFHNIPTAIAKEDQLLRATLALARHEGLSSALRILDKPTRKKYIKQLKPYMTDWWNPDEIWNQSSKAVGGIINPIEMKLAS